MRFGSYELLALLGKGGMARVFRAVRSGPHGFSKEVALKVLDPTATATADQIAGLTDEARLGGLLRHQNIVSTDELGQVGPYYYIAMELVEGWPLDALLDVHRERETPVPRMVILDVLIAICTGLAYAHELAGPDGKPLHLVHRDMKPGNVMLSRRGEVKVMDFGIAKATTNLYMTQEQTTRGTPLFMSPEQVMGKALDCRSDLFALGGVIHELVALRPTFAGNDVVPVLRAVLSVEIDEATERIQAAFPQILPIFLRCMQQEPEARYPDARAMRRDLEALRRRFDTGISLGRWVRQMATTLSVPQNGDLGNALPGGLALPQRPTSVEDLDIISLPQDAVESVFVMPLGPESESHATPVDQTPSETNEPKALPSRIDLSRKASARPQRPARNSAPSRKPRTTATKPPTWQRRAARRAAWKRLIILGFAGVGAIFLGTFAPGRWGQVSQSLWNRLIGWIGPFLGL